MEQSGSQQEGIFEFQFPGEDLGYRTGMTDVRGAGLSLLAFVEFVGKFQGAEKNTVFLIIFIEIPGHARTIVVQIEEVGLASGSCWKSIRRFALCDQQSLASPHPSVVFLLPVSVQLREGNVALKTSSSIEPADEVSNIILEKRQKRYKPLNA